MQRFGWGRPASLNDHSVKGRFQRGRGKVYKVAATTPVVTREGLN